MAGEGKMTKPVWLKPENKELPKLMLYNSLTRRKEEFIPLSGRRVLWYSCGPTVYDASHMGHARSYITFDILRRVLSDYFNYEVVYVMNITDIDDKIIRRARWNYLLDSYIAEQHGLEDIVHDITEALEIFRKETEDEPDHDRKRLLTNTLSQCQLAIEEYQQDSARGVFSSDLKEKLLEAARDPLAAWLDKKYGSKVTDHKIFAKLAKHWEEEYHKDMAALNVLPPDTLTRISDYVEEVVTFTEDIISNGYAYESNGSVYFDVPAFSSSPNHYYAKLVPEAVGDLKALAEGEGILSVATEQDKEKKCQKDFALWKASKPGEPAWPSPWGSGRPGWHIECSVMACNILGEKADIHTGGEDLKFPHHDNEMAQVEACYDHNQWISYFLHSGHLTIEGCKMSKSLKNFVTIKEALQKHSSRQLRLFFLLHAWNTTLDYSEQAMKEAIHWEKMFNDFFLHVKDMIHKQPTGVESYIKFSDRDKELLWKVEDIKLAVHKAMCDSINTVAVMKLLRELIGSCNVYLSETGSSVNVRLVESAAVYVTRTLKVFGVIPDSTLLGFPFDSKLLGDSNLTEEEAIAIPLAQVIAEFREEVRTTALGTKASTLLKLCDQLRDEKLPLLGVHLEDKGGNTVIKYVGRQTGLKKTANK